MATANTEREPGIFTRGVFDECEIRAIDEGSRTAEFVAATERGVDTWAGKEYLRMTGVRLTRYRKNPVVLDAHDRYSAGSVIGRADVKVEGKQLVATVTFAPTARAEEIWQLVKGKFIRALSVGFMPDASKIQRLDAGQIDGEGEDAITGPARIIRGWELYEISVVPVPADADALRRTFLEGEPENLAPLARSLAAIVERLTVGGKGLDMPDDTKPAPQVEAAVVARESDGELRRLALAEGRARAIRAVAPESCRSLADQLIQDDTITYEAACKRFLEELQKDGKPAGSQEPKEPESVKSNQRTADVSDDMLLRSLIG